MKTADLSPPAGLLSTHPDLLVISAYAIDGRRQPARDIAWTSTRYQGPSLQIVTLERNQVILAHRQNPPDRSIGMNPSRSRPLASLNVAGPFSMGYVDFYTFLIPLYGLSLGFDASEIGILVGARSVVAMFLAIHIGVLMDRFGTRKVTLFCVWTGMALTPLFPLMPWFWPCCCCN